LFWNPWAVVFVGLPLYLLHRNVLVRQLEDAATTDSKTGLLNAGTWQSLAAKEVERAQRHNTQLGLLMIDVDHFKSVNDRYSHLVGDQALHAIADVLRGSVRNYDLVGRFGGEEFVILLVGTDHTGSVEVGHRICERVRELRIEDALTGGTYPDLHLSVSVGVAMFPGAGTSLQDVLLAADNAVFAAKDAGRDQVLAIQPAENSPNHDAGASPL
jgi:diguanylate cyclase (GGDEF)-like protein